MTATSSQVSDAVHAALSRWPNGVATAKPDQCWIELMADDEDGWYRLTIETLYRNVKMAPNPASAETVLSRLRELAAQAAAAADAIEATIGAGA